MGIEKVKKNKSNDTNRWGNGNFGIILVKNYFGKTQGIIFNLFFVFLKGEHTFVKYFYNLTKSL